MSDKIAKIMPLKDWEIENGACTPLPCPFCGGKAKVQGVSWHNDAIYLGCYNEECPVEPSVFDAVPSEAVLLWNTRAPGGSDL